MKAAFTLICMAAGLVRSQCAAVGQPCDGFDDKQCCSGSKQCGLKSVGSAESGSQKTYACMRAPEPEPEPEPAAGLVRSQCAEVGQRCDGFDDKQCCSGSKQCGLKSVGSAESGSQKTYACMRAPEPEPEQCNSQGTNCGAEGYDAACCSKHCAVWTSAADSRQLGAAVLQCS